MRYVKHILLVFVLLFAVLGISLWTGSTETMAVLFPFASWGGMFYLAFMAYTTRVDRVRGFSLSAAANVVQGFGIISMVAGTAVALWIVGNSKGNFVALSDVPLATLVGPFVEGLVAVGLGIFCSVLLNFIDYTRFGGESEEERKSRVETAAGAGVDWTRVGSEVDALVAALARAREPALGLETDLASFRKLLEGAAQLVAQLDRFFVERPKDPIAPSSSPPSA